MIEIPEPKVVELPLRCALGGVFLYAGVMKALDAQQFAIDIQHYELTSWTVSVIAAVYLPWLEILVGVALLARWLYAGALAIFSLLTVVFLAAILSAWWRGLDITCGCFGREENRTNFPQHIALNLAMLTAAGVLAWLEWRASRTATMPTGSTQA